MKDRLFFGSMLFALLAITLCACARGPSSEPTAAASGQPQPSSTPGLGRRTKTSGCVVNGKLPDAACTPGAVIETATKEQICEPGYSKNVRDVTTSEKDKVYAEYGITHHSEGEYEVDHLISLEMGGSNDIANLWPEAAEPRPGFHEKDKVENYLHDQMCSGAISLAQAQYEISTDWTGVYQKMPNK
jgi:hypothetical protein